MDLSNSPLLLMGGCGFLGQSIAEHLTSKGYSVRIFDRPGATEKAAVKNRSVEYFSGDFGNPDSYQPCLNGVDTVIHLIHSTIPSTSMSDMVYDVESNVIPSIRLFESLTASGVSKVIFISSGGTVYGVPESIPVTEKDVTLPISSYGISKLTIEKYLHIFSQEYGFCGISVRLSNPYGKFQLPGTPIGAVANFLQRVFYDRTIEIWGDGSVVRDYIHISDVLDAIEGLVRRELEPGIYNLGHGKGYSLKEVLDIIRAVTGRLPTIAYKERREFDVPQIVLNCRKLMSAINWSPKMDLPDGIRQLWEFLQHSYPK